MITSRDNRFVRLAKRLLSISGARREEGLFVIEGARLCSDAALSGVMIRTLLFTADAAALYAAQLEAISKVCVEEYEISPSISRAIGDTSSPQGVFCICELLDNRASLDTIEYNTNPKTKYLALESLQDPANMGGVIRTAEAFGISGLLLSDGCCDVYNPKVLRGSMGGVFRLPLINVGNMTSTVKRLEAAGVNCLACVADRHALSIGQAGLNNYCICVIGNEGNGLRPETIEACSEKVTIPMTGRAESLNAAMAAGIVMWEMTK